MKNLRRLWKKSQRRQKSSLGVRYGGYHLLNMNEIVITQAFPEDAETVCRIQSQTWIDTYPNAELGITEEDIRVRLEGENGERTTKKIDRWRQIIESADDKHTVFVARLGGVATGFIAPRTDEDNKHRIGALYVLPEAQGKGVGTALMEKALEWLGKNDDIYLCVVAYNTNAIKFYERFGFIKTDNQVVDESAISGGFKELPEFEMVLRGT